MPWARVGSLSLAAAWLSLGAIGGAECASAQPPVAAGIEFQVNTATIYEQSQPAVASDADGDFVVVWESSIAVGDSSSFEIFGRRFARSGLAQGGEFRVNTYTSGLQLNPAIASDDAGNFVIAWESEQDGSARGVFARRFNSSGIAQAVEFQVNTFTVGYQDGLAVGMSPTGAFVIAWKSPQDGYGLGVFARRFTAAGVAQAVEFQANSFTAGNERAPAVDLAANGDFVIVWEGTGQEGPTRGIYAQRFSSAGVRQGSEFHVNTYFISEQSLPSVGLSKSGAFVVAWQSNLEDGSGYGVFARRYDASGTALGGEIPINVTTLDSQTLPRVAADADGDFAVVWQSYYNDGSQNGIFMRRFKANGDAGSLDRQVNTYTPGNQNFGSLATDDAGDFAVAWRSPQDGSSYGVFAQRFEVSPTIDIDGDGSYSPLTDGILLLRFGFGFTGATLVTGAVAPGCTRCDVASITAYLGSLL